MNIPVSVGLFEYTLLVMVVFPILSLLHTMIHVCKALRATHPSLEEPKVYWKEHSKFVGVTCYERWVPYSVRPSNTVNGVTLAKYLTATFRMLAVFSDFSSE